MIRYKLLYNFPQEIIDNVTKFYFEHYNDDEEIIYKIDNKKNHEDAQRFKYEKQIVDTIDPILKKEVMYLLTRPQSERIPVHIDDNGPFGINVPIRVHPTLGNFITLKEGRTAVRNSTVRPTFDYVEDDMEYVSVTHPIFFSSQNPHTFENKTDEWRVMVFLQINADTIEDAWELVKKWQ